MQSSPTQPSKKSTSEKEMPHSGRFSSESSMRKKSPKYPLSSDVPDSSTQPCGLTSAIFTTGAEFTSLIRTRNDWLGLSRG